MEEAVCGNDLFGVSAALPVSLSPGSTPLIDGTTTTFFATEQTTADTQLTQTLPGEFYIMYWCFYAPSVKEVTPLIK
jgi:hypothetical protein